MKKEKKNGTLYRDLACLSPAQFKELKISLHHGALQKLSEVLKQFDNDVTLEKLRSELVSLANNWDRLKNSISDEYTLYGSDSENESEAEFTLKENGEVLYSVQTTVCKRCRDCAVCVYFTLDNYNLFSNAYKNIGLAYKYLLTLSTT